MRGRLLTSVFALALLASCAAQGGIKVTLDEYTLKTSQQRADAGAITFTARNIGDIAHQLLILRTKRAADDLPVRKGVVLLDARGIDVVGEIDIIAEDDAEPVTVTLDPGRYVLICNIASHYSNGMHTSLVVETATS